MHIKQQESQKGSCHSTGHRLNTRMHTHSYHRKEGSHQNSDTAGQSIQSVCKIGAVYRSNNNKEQNGNIKPSKIQVLTFQERNLHSKRYLCIPGNIYRKHAGHYNL